MSPTATKARAALNGSAPKTTIRVAAYTRKSTDAGLEQSFNSLDAQRASIEAFVESQRAEGWVLLPELYDDGGYTGANTDRPAFQRLMSDIEAAKIDAIAIYRLDRVSRSVADFVRLIEYLESKDVKLISVTEQFSTSTSMGKFVVHLLISIAQLERETTAQRTADKMQASRRKGMFTGGTPPLGLDIRDKKLVVNAKEVEDVRTIFRTYRTLGGLVATVEALARRGIKTKSWINRNGMRVPAKPFDKSTLRSFLSNPLLAGLIRSNGEFVPAQHEAIIPREEWDEVQTILHNHGKRGSRRRTSSDALLAGLTVCARCGSAMTPHYASRNQRRWLSYVCTRVQKEGAAACRGSRIAARELEQHVIERVAFVGHDPNVIAATIAAAKKSATTRRPQLMTDIGTAETERKRLDAERTNYLDAIGADGSSPQLMQRLGETEAALHQVNERLGPLRAELAGLESGIIEPEDVKRALGDWDVLWSVLFPAERQRILQLLIEEIRVDRQAGDVEIRFRPNGLRAFAQERATSERSDPS
ncbi:MAG: recombinase family protein [Planctomycetes bacterium]|nr:recombinase family protein [Planctomycetota bacterium]MBI3843542.1 recombinase family protein [Planctomycetota bacterium]